MTSLLSPSGPRARLTSFIFHRVLDKPDPLLTGEPDVAEFDRMLDWITAQFTVLDPLEACERLVGGALPARSAMISFDDGYRDNYENALPLLARRGLSAVFFIATGFMDGGAMFNDRIIAAVRGSRVESAIAPWDQALRLGFSTLEEKRKAIKDLIAAIKYLPLDERSDRIEWLVDTVGSDAPSGLMMNALQVVGLAQAGMKVGGHTRTHPILLSLGEGAAKAEIAACRSDLAMLLQYRPELFAYPNGRLDVDYGSSHCEMVRREGFRFAFTTHPGFARQASDVMQLGRFTPWDRTPMRFGLRAMSNLVPRGKSTGPTD